MVVGLVIICLLDLRFFCRLDYIGIYSYSNLAMQVVFVFNKQMFCLLKGAEQKCEMERVNFKRLNVMEVRNSISLKLEKGF